MRYKTKRIVLGTAAAAAVALTLAGAAVAGQSAAAAAQGPGVGGGPGRGFGGPGGPGGPGRGGRGGPGMGGPMMILRGLNLTEAQQTRVREILDSHRDEQQTLGDRSFAAHSALDAAVNGATFDEGAVRARAAELAAVEADMAVLHARTFAEVFQILTPEQQDQAKKQQSQMREREQQRQANRPRRGQA